MAAAINSPAPAAETVLPEIETVHPIETIRDQAEFSKAGEAFKEVALWDGDKLSAESDLNLMSDVVEINMDDESESKVSATAKKIYISAEQSVRSYFADIPIMIEVAKCESRFRHYDTTGGVLRGDVNHLDRGVMQINEGYHLSTAQKLGYDILTLEGNLAYARYLYEKQGTRPWKSSSPCWAGKVYAEIAQS